MKNLGYETKRVAGVEAKALPGSSPPPAHDPETGGSRSTPVGAALVGAGAVPAGVMPGVAPSPVSPAEALGEHFIRCFFCRVGAADEPVDHFCETGRELAVAVLDEVAERTFA